MAHSRSIRARLTGVVIVVAMVLLGDAGNASANVTITPSTVNAGDVVDFTVHVPNGNALAETISFELDVPDSAHVTVTDAPLIAGWTATVDRIGDSVSKITWDSGRIPRDGAVDFPVTIGVPKDVDSLQLAAVQTFSDASTLRWADLPVGGSPGAHPAVIVTIKGAVTTTSTSTSTTAGPTASTTKKASSSTSSKKGNLSPGSILIAVGAGIAAFTVLRARNKRRTKAKSSPRRESDS
jgi:periplasmic copper chaperone A